MAEDEVIESQSTPRTIVGRFLLYLIGLLSKLLFWFFTSRFLVWFLLGPETPHLRIGGAFVSLVFAIALLFGTIYSRVNFASLTALIDLYPVSTRVSGILIVLISGIGLYYIKRRARLGYGLVEMGFALAAGWQAVGGISTGGFPGLIAFVASVYFGVRGAENSYLGYEELREHVLELAMERHRKFMQRQDLPEPSPKLDPLLVQRFQELGGIIDAKLNKKP